MCVFSSFVTTSPPVRPAGAAADHVFSTCSLRCSLSCLLISPGARQELATSSKPAADRVYSALLTALAHCPACCFSPCVLQELATSSNPAAVEAGLLIIANLASYSTDHMRPHLAGLQPLLANCLNHAAIDVQVSREEHLYQHAALAHVLQLL
jgi:hypothetical protein